MKNQTQHKPTASKFSLLRQLCNFIPPHLVPRLARQTVSGWGSTSSFSRWIMKPCGHGFFKNWIRPAALDL